MRRTREAISGGGYHISLNAELEDMELEGDLLIAAAITERALLPEIYDQRKGITLKLRTDGWLARRSPDDSLCEILGGRLCWSWHHCART